MESLEITSLPQELSAGPDWLVDKRKSSRQRYNRFSADGLPTRTAHLWRYTDPALFTFADSDNKGAVSTPSSDAPSHKQALAQLKENRLAAVALDLAGETVSVSAGSIADKHKIIVMSLKEATTRHHELIQSKLYSAVGADFGKFEALNATLWSDGLFVYVPKNARFTEPIHLLRRGAANERWWYGRTLIIVEEDAEVTIIDEYFSADDTTPARSNHVVEVFAGANSHIHYVPLQRNNLKSLSYFTQRTILEERAKSVLIAATLGGKTHKADLGAVMIGRDAESLQYGLVFGSEKQRLDHHTVHIHRAPHGYSNLDFKVALKDKSKSAYTGLIRVDENVENCEAYQTNRNLLLNPGASAQSIPELEILCHEVICTHGTTVGPIDEMQIFYAMCRGISHSEAVKMCVRGHMEPTLKALPETLREQVRGYIEQRLETL
ncbi:SufD family Fe-S cluster assembly protein [Gemmatimonas aurantiaca]|nr:SufD family Fe-S cluster assembly protein [Gemmatimonas aurantiaca]